MVKCNIFTPLISRKFFQCPLFCQQITLQQKVQSLDDVTRDRDEAISKLDKATLRLEEASAKLAKKEDELESASVQFQDLSNSLKQTKDSMEKEVTKWKMLYMK